MLQQPEAGQSSPTFEEVLKARLRAAGHPYVDSPPPRRLGPKPKRIRYRVRKPKPLVFLRSPLTGARTPCKTAEALDDHDDRTLLRAVAHYLKQFGYWPYWHPLSRLKRLREKALHARIERNQACGRLATTTWLELTPVGWAFIYQDPVQPRLPQNSLLRGKLRERLRKFAMYDNLDQATKDYLRSISKVKRPCTMQLPRYLPQPPSPHSQSPRSSS